MPDILTNEGAKAPSLSQLWVEHCIFKRRLSALERIVKETTSFEHLNQVDGSWAAIYWANTLSEFKRGSV